MAGEEEFQLCPNCKVGRLKPTGLAATSADPQTTRGTKDLSGYKCDNCGYPRDGVARVFQNNEDLNVTDSSVATVKYSDGSGEGDTSSSISNKDDQQ